MKGILIVLAALLLADVGNASAADISARIRELTQKTEKLGAGSARDFAKEMLDNTRTSTAAAQAAFAAGNDRAAVQQLELAAMQLLVAETQSAGREVAEEVAVRRAELKKLESQLERYLQGEE